MILGLILISTTKVFKEKLVKQSLLDNQELFELNGKKIGKSRIVFEKVVIYGKLRCDALIFTENKGIIGVEIKTEYDNLKRLARQLSYYKKVCNYVYVYCHDSHLNKVIKLIKDKHLDKFVGVISYSIFKDEVIPGVYQPAKLNPDYRLASALQMLWKSEIRDILRVTTSQQAKLIAAKEGLNYIPIFKDPVTQLKISSMPTTYGIASERLTKPQLVKNYLKLYGQRQGTVILCQRFIYNDNDPTKYLKLFNFKGRIDQPLIVGDPNEII